MKPKTNINTPFQTHSTPPFRSDFSFISSNNKENIPLNSNNSVSKNNIDSAPQLNSKTSSSSLSKSYTSNIISPTISRKSSINKHLRKKSSTKLKQVNSHSRNSSQSSTSFSNFLKNLSRTPTRDAGSKSIFNRVNNNSNHGISAYSTKTDFSTSPIFKTASTKFSNDYCSSDDDLISDNENDRVDISKIMTNSTNNHINFDEVDDIPDLMDFGSPIQRKKSNSNSLFRSRNNNDSNKHFQLKRHQSLYNYDHKVQNFDFSASSNSNFDTDQLTSTINELSVSNGIGNCVLDDAPFQTAQHEDNIPRISVSEFKNILYEFKNKESNPNGKFCKYFDDLLIIDCRFKFEFDGGHIDGAINVSSIDELNNVFSDTFNSQVNPIEAVRQDRKLVVFHCEFSSHRGPLKAIELRKIDRHICSEYYPNLYYPEVLILEGGYKEYYESEKTLDRSLSYIEMDHPSFIDERNKNLDLIKKESNIRSSRSSRSNSYVSLSRKSSHSSIKSMLSCSFLDFSSVNKIDYKPSLKQRPSKRSLHNLSVQQFDKSINNQDEVEDFEESRSPFSTSNLSNHLEKGIFGGLGNQNIDLDCLVEDSNDFADCNSLSATKSIEQLNIPNPFHSGNDGFKVPHPKGRLGRKGSLHSRSKTVSSFSYTNHSGFRSAPLLTTPEKSEAKFGNYQFYQHDTTSVLSVLEDSEFDENNDDEYVSIYSQRFNNRHLDTPLKDKRNGEHK